MSMTAEEFRPYLRSTVRQVINPDLVIQVFDDVLRAAVAHRDQQWTHALHHAQENTPGGGEFRSSPTGPDIALCEEMFIGHEAAAVLAEREAHQPIIDLWQFIRENGSCFSGSGNRPCRLNESDDPKEYCLYHKAWAIQARTEGR